MGGIPGLMGRLEAPKSRPEARGRANFPYFPQPARGKWALRKPWADGWRARERGWEARLIGAAFPLSLHLQKA